MKSALDILEQEISKIMAEVTGQGSCAAMVTPATDPKFGDYQVNGVMPLAKQLKTNPRKLAEQIVAKLNISDICQSPEVAGPGFINLRLKPEFVAARLLEVSEDYVQEVLGEVKLPPYLRFGIPKVENPKTVVVDFSGPNIAKEMHVGHLRSTIIGDFICNILDFLGHKVVKQNHIGDWGTQFGMLCALYERKRKEAIDKGEKTFPYLPIHDLDAFYKEASHLFNTDEKFASEAREAIASLHQGDQLWMSHWNEIVRASKAHYEEIYEMLGWPLSDVNTRGESFYKNMLQDVVSELKKKGLVVQSEGAVCVFPKGFKDKEGEPLPVIVRKSDGAYLYATTDLAAIRYRMTGIEYEGETYKADEIIYVTDARQSLHFDMVFTVAEMAGWAKREMLHHVTFGSVLGEDSKPLKTRSGENVKLKELLNEAVERARKIVDEKNPGLSEERKAEIAKAVGIGAVKYADYSNNRTSDYIFSFDKMLAMEGNTAPYMQYAYARVKSINRKGKERGIDVDKELTEIKTQNSKLKTQNFLTESSELDLAKHLIRYGEAVEAAVADYRPNYLTSYLNDLAQKFSVFYTNCPVLDAPTDPSTPLGAGKRPTRLLLCDLTAKIIKHGLSELLGIRVVDEM